MTWDEQLFRSGNVALLVVQTLIVSFKAAGVLTLTWPMCLSPMFVVGAISTVCAAYLSVFS